MGWTFYYPNHFTKKGKVDRKAEADNLFSEKFEVLKSQMVGSVYYGAIREIKTGSVFASVILTKVSDGDFGYKAMDETCGPVYYDCPKSILELLSPIDSDWANEWRKKCHERLSKPSLAKLPIGTKIKITYSDGKEVILTKHEPCFQFKRPFWFDEKKYVYMSKKYIPDNWEIIES